MAWIDLRLVHFWTILIEMYWKPDEFRCNWYNAILKRPQGSHGLFEATIW